MSLSNGGAVYRSLDGEILLAEFHPERVCKLPEILRQLDYRFVHARSSDDVVCLTANPPKIVILATSVSANRSKSFQIDLKNAQYFHERLPECQLLFMVNNSVDVETCMQAIKLGVCGFVNIDEPDFVELLDEQIKQTVDNDKDTSYDYHDYSQVLDQTGIATQSSVMIDILGQAKKAASVCDAPIIIEGESGTGKQLLAEAVHKMDPKRSDKPFLSVNCAAITGTLAESALFGHKKGAFTGATEDREGYFRSANGGTLLLDEISELEPHLQPKLLRVLQASKVLPVGDDKEKHVDVRIIAASNKPLSTQVADNKFRLDLYQRLNVIKLKIPPLRQRVDDIPLLVQYFVKKYKHYYRKSIHSVDPAVHTVLKYAVGKGNVRELENIVRQSLAMKDNGTIFTVADLPDHVLESVAEYKTPQIPSEVANHIVHQLRNGDIKLNSILRNYESQVLKTAINDFGLKGTQLAQRLGLNRRTLYHKLKKYNLA